MGKAESSTRVKTETGAEHESERGRERGRVNYSERERERESVRQTAGNRNSEKRESAPESESHPGRVSMGGGRAANTGFGAQLRGWRQRRGLTQMAMAMAAEVSARHLSWPEADKS